MHFLRHARGSLAELETQLLIAEQQKYAETSDVDILLKDTDELSRILSGLINSIKVKRPKTGIGF